MRFISAYYLMLIYVTVVIKPLMPFICDAWSHQFNEIEHISLIHAKYGSNHLEKELAGAETGSDKSQGQNSLRSEDQVSYHVSVPEVVCDFHVYDRVIEYLPFILYKPSAVCILKQGQPPKFSW